MSAKVKGVRTVRTHTRKDRAEEIEHSNWRTVSQDVGKEGERTFRYPVETIWYKDLLSRRVPARERGKLAGGEFAKEVG
jgi:hypothetical protein